MPNFIDRLLNRITMYRLVLYVLIAYLSVAFVFGLFGILSYSPLAILFSSLFLTAICWIANGILAKLFRAQTNVESAYITALILAAIITPVSPTNASGIVFLLAAGIFAMASKYILTIKKKHLFNPAAIAVVLTAVLMGQYASWWICGNLPMLAFILIGGFLIVRKVQRFDLALAFIFGAIVSILATTAFSLSIAEATIVHTPILFFASIMITEPQTTPPTRRLRILYGLFVGLIYSPAIHLGPVYATPEIVLVVGNLASYFVSSKWKRTLTLEEKTDVGGGIHDFVFAGATELKFQPGQYLEFTLGHKKTDSRGNRRYFTIASSPTEKNLRLGVRFYDNPSSFKKKMIRMEPGDEILAGSLEGDFTLPRDKEKKLAFIAGGIGITPFRSMVKYLTDTGEKRDAVLFYSNRATADIAYREVFDEAERTIGLRTIYAVTGTGEALPKNTTHSSGVRGRINAAMIEKEIPDYRERTFYISGTQAMVTGFEKILREMGVASANVKSDFFPGFV